MSSLIRILRQIDIAPLLSFYNSIQNQIKWANYGAKGKQAGIQYVLGEDVWNSAPGKRKGDELISTELNPLFEKSPFHNLIDEFKLKRSRLMWVGPYACYSMHKDTTPRIHIPLVTNKNCYFVFKSLMPIHLEQGNVYWTDTRTEHTFMNCSDVWRLHFIGVSEH